jgi:hypothetical protein
MVGHLKRLNPLSSHQRALYDAAEEQRKLCRDWLIYIMSASSERTRTKSELCAEAMQRFKVSKNAFDAAWIRAIEKTGNHHWYDPLPRSKKKGGRTLLV